MLMDKQGRQEHHWPVHSVPRWPSFSQGFLSSQGKQNPLVSTFGVSKMYPGPRTISHDLAHHLLSSIDDLKQCAQTDCVQMMWQRRLVAACLVSFQYKELCWVRSMSKWPWTLPTLSDCLHHDSDVLMPSICCLILSLWILCREFFLNNILIYSLKMLEIFTMCFDHIHLWLPPFGAS